MLQELLANPNYKILKRVPNYLKPSATQAQELFRATIIDLETTGVDPNKDEIIEIGLLSFSFSNDEGIIQLLDSYAELQEPQKPIPAKITQITGIKNEDVCGKVINWVEIERIITQSHLLICHNSRFDRNFLELQTPQFIKVLIEKKPFGCTAADINWKKRGYEGKKLEYLNFKLGFFYEGHRAIADCWATLNLLLNDEDAFNELKINVKRKQVLIGVRQVPFAKKFLLKNRRYRWSDGNNHLPKCWYKIISSDALAGEKEWLNAYIYNSCKIAIPLMVIEITAYKRYSYRAEQVIGCS